MWKIKNFELEAKIVIFKTMTTSKIIFQLLIKTFSKHSVNEFKKNTKEIFLEKLYSQEKKIKDCMIILFMNESYSGYP